MSTPKQHRRITNPKNSPYASPKAVVQQHLKDGTDINQIVARARRGIPPTNVREPGQFIDLSKIPEDLTQAFNQVESAWESFMTLPARAREELGNDPRRLSTADLGFFERHGLTRPKAVPEIPNQGPTGVGGGTPPVAKKAAKQLKSDLEDQQ